MWSVPYLQVTGEWEYEPSPSQKATGNWQTPGSTEKCQGESTERVLKDEVRHGQHFPPPNPLPNHYFQTPVGKPVLLCGAFSVAICQGWSGFPCSQATEIAWSMWTENEHFQRMLESHRITWWGWYSRIGWGSKLESWVYRLCHQKQCPKLLCRTDLLKTHCWLIQHLALQCLYR